MQEVTVKLEGFKKVKDEDEDEFKGVLIKVEEEVEEGDIVEANFLEEHIIIKTECRESQ